MIACHRLLAAGEAPELALQAAVSGYLSAHTGRARNVYFWAPFFLLDVGHPEISTRRI
jgi:hypothetical protein